MTRKNFLIRLVAVVLIMTAMLSTTATAAAPHETEYKTVYITWQYPIPPSEKGDKLNMSVGVLMNGQTYAPHDVFDILDIPKCPKCEGTILTVDGVTDVYYPLRESAEQFGYTVLWAPKSEQDGEVLDHWVYIAQKETNGVWVQVLDHEVPEDNYKFYGYHYAHCDDGQYCWFVTEDDMNSIPKENATIVK